MIDAVTSALGIPQWARAMGVPITDGTYYFIHSGTGSNGYDGKSREKPFATVAYALDNTSLAAGDVIVVLPGHTEAIAAAAGWDIDTAGVQVAGIPGIPTNRMPVITLGTATTADIDFDAAGTGVHNLRFKVGIDSLANMLDVNAANVQIKGCIFDEPTAVLRALKYMDFAATSTEFEIADCYNVGVGSTTTVANKNNAIVVVTSRDWSMKRCRFFGSWLTGLVSLTTGASLMHFISDCQLHNIEAQALVNDGGQAHTGHYSNIRGSVGGASSVALATAVFDESNSLVTYSDILVSNDAKERGAGTGTAST